MFTLELGLVQRTPISRGNGTVLALPPTKHMTPFTKCPGSLVLQTKRSVSKVLSRELPPHDHMTDEEGRMAAGFKDTTTLRIYDHPGIQLSDRLSHVLRIHDEEGEATPEGERAISTGT
jgi:hypothetical protein